MCKCVAFETLQHAVLITQKNEIQNWTQRTPPSSSRITWLEGTFIKAWGVRHKMSKFIYNQISCWVVKGQLTTGLLKTGKYTFTILPYDVRFRDEQSGVYVRQIDRRSEGSLLQGRITLIVRHTCTGKVNLSNFVIHSISCYDTLNWTGG